MQGKQSLTFAALDERVTATVGSSPGVPIASPYHFSSENYYGESPRTGGVTCTGPKWWLCSSIEYDGHPERYANQSEPFHFCVAFPSMDRFPRSAVSQ